MFSYSFWADEGYISGVAALLVRGQATFLQTISMPGVTYQKLNMLVIALFFKLFGTNEFVARLPSLLIFFAGVFVIFFLVKRLSNVYGGAIAAFIYCFSHLNLAYATQAKPYIAIEVITLTVIYVLLSISQQKNIFRIILQHFAVITLLIGAFFLHYIGVFLLVLYLVHTLLSFKYKNVFIIKKFNILWLLVIPMIGILMTELVPLIIRNFSSPHFFAYNFTYQTTKLFLYKYSLILATAGVGWLWSFNKNKKLNISIAIFCLVVFIMASFNVYIFNIRYVLSLFGILFLYFGIFWAKVGEKYDNNFKFKIYNLKLSGKIVIPLAVIVLLYATGYKIVRWPQAYYNPNIDKYGDVQIANYKDFYTELKQKFPDYKNMYVVNDTFDVEYWYFGRYSNAYLMKFVAKPYQHPTVKNAIIYGSLEDFKKIMKDHPQGLLIMEDWQSFLPDDIKMYAKKNLKLEFRVESLKEATNDPWPLALYSWGLK